MIKLSDYIAKRLVEYYGVKHIFMISGGGAMHLNDSFGKQSGLTYICNHHEQASAIAAEGYARVAGKLAVVNVTTGPGGTNTLTGVLGQWTDSVPVLYISGQVKYETTIASCPELELRQLGDQEVDIVSIVKPITKFAYMIRDPYEIKSILDKAIIEALSGRPGPVWIDIPLNIQGALIDEEKLYNSDDEIRNNLNLQDIKEKDFIDFFSKSKRPLIIAGHGVRIAKAKRELLDFANKYRIPIVTTFNGVDLIENSNELFIGRIGTLGSRAGNFALQNSDLIISLGTRNNIRQASYNWKMFARSAKKIIVDIDENELEKPTVIPDLGIKTDVKYFLDKANTYKINIDCSSWLEWCKERKRKFPALLEEHKISQSINPYVFMEKFTNMIAESSVIVAGNGTACVTAFQTGIIKEKTRMFWNSGCASMGYDIPAAIGACYANEKKEVYCIAGDGSAMMNIQELMTIKHNEIPVKIILLNNDGYISIKQTQESFFQGRYVASGNTSGVGMPDFIKVAESFGLKTFKIEEYQGMEEKINEIIEYKGPLLCEVMLDRDYKFMPKLSSKKLEDGRMISKPLEDLFPFLSKEEMIENMIVPLIKEN